MQVSVIIPNFNGKGFLGPCLNSVLEQEHDADEVEVLLIDNGSSDGSVDFVRDRYPSVRCEELATNTGFTGAINFGVQAAHGGLLLLLNNDTVMEPGSLRLLVNALKRCGEKVGAIQPLLVNAKDALLVDSSGIILRRHFTAADGHHGRPISEAPTTEREVFGVCLACALMRREMFEQSGGLDPDFFAEWDDVDLALRSRWLGWSFILVPQARVRHHRSPTQSQMPRDRFIRYRRNRLLTCVKGLPGGMVFREVFYRLQKDLFSAPHHIRRRQCGAVLASWLKLVRLLPQALRRRKELRRGAVLPASRMRALIAGMTE